MTDWNAEAELRKEYIRWRVDHNELPSLKQWLRKQGILSNPLTPEDVIRIFTATGVLYTTPDRQEPCPVTYEGWLRNVKGMGKTEYAFECTVGEMARTPLVKYLMNKML